MTDTVNHPPHYTGHPSGVECITITEHMGFNLGNATKYIWRADLKGNAIEDLEKARWYIEREIQKRQTPPPDELQRVEASAWEACPQHGTLCSGPSCCCRDLHTGAATR